MARRIDFNTLTNEQLTNIDTLDIETAGTTGWHVDQDSLEFHDTTSGAQIIGKLVHENNHDSKLGLWYKNGQPFLGMDIPALEAFTDTPEPVIEEPVPEGVRRIFVNIYRAEHNEHGFTIGSKTSTSRADMVARGQRAAGEYLGTVPVLVPAELVD